MSIKKRKSSSSKTRDGAIVFYVRGVVSMVNPHAPDKGPVQAMIPRTSGHGHPGHGHTSKVPRHHPFVRFPMDGGYDARRSTRSLNLRFDARDPLTPGQWGAVLLGDKETIAVEGGVPTEPFAYDRFNLESLEIPRTIFDETAFHWVPKLKHICAAASGSRECVGDLLIEINHGTLGALPPFDIWVWDPRKEGGTRYRRSVADGVTWRLASKFERFSVAFSGGGKLVFETNRREVEIGNYPLEDILTIAEHVVHPGDLDPHFQLYYDMLPSQEGHKGKFHLPKYEGPYKVRMNTGGPSCGPTTRP